MTDITLDIQGILKHLPHRPPFLLVDRVLKFEPSKSLVAIKNVTINEPFFVGHFPKRPVMPGVLIIEALAQAAGILAFLSTDEDPQGNSLYFFAGIDNARFKRIVEPGDQLHLEVEITKMRKNLLKAHGVAKVGDEIACSADLMSIKAPAKK
ncbi:MAG: 3-hydroxyacyl-ACP dehydratase FabZ [Gammaproteobacteria bacterium]|jgi:3-hydroxyacyl-[acyl-carrier-protein] dehydratase